MHKIRQIVIKSKAKLKNFKQIRTYEIFAIFESFQDISADTMPTLRLTKEFRFEGATPKSGMLIDFTDLKRIVNEGIIDRFDHALILRDTSPIAEEIAGAYQRVLVVPFQPTCENLILHFADIIRQALPQGVSLHSLRLHETATSYVEWFESDNE